MAEVAEDVYPAIYYQTIRDTGIDPVVCGDIGVPTGVSVEAGTRPVQLADKALAKATEGGAKVARKRAPRKATGAGAAARSAAKVTPSAKMANAKAPVVPAQAAPVKAARGTAKVANATQ